MSGERPGDELLSELAAQRLDGDIDDQRWELLLRQHPETLAAMLAQQQRLAAAMRSLPREAHDPALAQAILSRIPWAAPVAAPARPRRSWHPARWASAALLAACLALAIHLQQRGSSPAPELVATRGPTSSALPQHAPADVLDGNREPERPTLAIAASPPASSAGSPSPAGPPPIASPAQAPFGGEAAGPALAANDQRIGEPTDAAPAPAPSSVSQAHLNADTATSAAKGADETAPRAHPAADDAITALTAQDPPASDAALAMASPARPAPALGGPAGSRERAALRLAQPVVLELLPGAVPRVRLRIHATTAQVLAACSLELVGTDAQGEAVWQHRLALPEHDWALSDEHPFSAELDLVGRHQPPQTVVTLSLSSPLGRSATLALPRAASADTPAAPAGP